MDEMSQVPRIPEFYSGKSVFVTGFTGFIGKALVEKLSWSCPDIRRIFVLLREKKGMTAQQRLDKILNIDLFGRLREHRKESLEKIVAVNGDCSLPGLGITPEQRAWMCSEVGVIFHGAASVRFDDPLVYTLDTNVKGTKSVVDLALDMPNLVSFVHISTAYANCDRFDIEEKIYPPHADWEKTLAIRDRVDEGVFNTLAQKYMNHMPNTYVFAKSLAEHIVSDHSKRIPVVVFRPSIVVSPIEDPFPGWLDNFNGPVGLLFGYGTGVVRTSLTDDAISPDFIPLDIAVRGLILTSYARHIIKSDEPEVYNWCTRDRTISNKDMVDMGKRLIETSPMKYLLWKPSTHTTSSKFLFYVYFVLFQMLPAFFIDIAIRVAGKKAIMWKLQRRIYIAMQALSYFTLNYFHFWNERAYAVADYLPREDVKEFYYLWKPHEVDEYDFFLRACIYLQGKYLKQTPQDLPRAKTLLQVLTILDAVVKSMFWLSVLYFIYKHQILQTIVFGTADFITNF